MNAALWLLACVAVGTAGYCFGRIRIGELRPKDWVAAPSALRASDDELLRDG